MTADNSFDAIVVGGGIMGAVAAGRLAEGGMRTALFEAASLGGGASGVNAGTLSLQIKRVTLMPYALRGHALWKQAGDRVGFHETGGVTLAFTATEAELLTARMTARREAGAPIELISADRARALEPGLSQAVTLASYCAADGYANASVTGAYYRERLREAGVQVFEHRAVERIEPDSRRVTIVARGGGVYVASRVLIATGAWTGTLSAAMGRPLPVAVRINTVSVTERVPRLVGRVIGHASGLLTLKQSANGTVLIGGGWQGRGSPESGRGVVVTSTLTTNLRLAQYAIPGLAAARIVRAWTGFEAHTPDYYPLAGLMPGLSHVYVLCCVRGGYTIGPCIGRLMGELMLDRAPELPLFDPGRFAEHAHA